MLCLLMITNGVLAQAPNIIIIFTDDLGYGDLSSYGHPTIRTPNLDQMANEGMRFTQFYVAASVCTPSRAGLLTGRYPVRTGMVKGSKIPGRVLFPNSKTGLPLRERTIAEILKEKDYITAMVGKWHLGHLPEYLPTRQGFDHYFGIPYSNDMDFISAKQGLEPYWNVPLMKDKKILERPAEQTTLTKRYTAKSIEFIKANTEGPFFLYLAHTMPHIPLFVSEEFEETSRRGLYGDVIEEIDWSVGKVLQTLKAEGLSENTLVIFTSDNGPWLVKKQDGGSSGLLKGGKGTTWEGGMRVPMIAWWPGSIPVGTINMELCTTLDLLPTVATLAEAEIPTDIDGVNLLALLKGASEAPRKFFAFYRNDEVYAVRYGPWKAHYVTQTEYPAGPQQFHSPPLLYQLEIDPSERFNVAKDHPEVITAIDQWLEKHNETVTSTRIPSLEAEAMIDQVKATGGKIKVQNMGNFPGQWGGDQQLWWVEAMPGDQLTFPVKQKAAAKGELYGFFTQAGNYGIIRVLVNGEPVGPLVDGYHKGVQPTGAVSFGQVQFKKGINKITVELVGKDHRAGGYSNGYLVGVDGFLIM
ncbi:MAG TPA: sulfatase [Cyclobacteriaceae bacterium]